MIQKNPVGWFEIPVEDMQRAINFYEKVFDIKLNHQDLGALEMAWFPFKENGIGSSGSLVLNKEFYTPSDKGTLIYFSAFSGDVAIELARAEAAGGKVVVPKKLISEDIGYMAVFLDSEGNRIALHARKTPG